MRFPPRGRPAKGTMSQTCPDNNLISQSTLSQPTAVAATQDLPLVDYQVSFDKPPRPILVPPSHQPRDPSPPQTAPVMSIQWLTSPSTRRAQHYTLPSQYTTTNTDAPWGSPPNMSGNTPTTDDEYPDVMARDKGKAREMTDSEDVHVGSHRQWRDDSL